MPGQFWRGVRVYVELLRQSRAAVVTAEALVWHHGYKVWMQLCRLLKSPADDLRVKVRAELVARLAADRYMAFKHADVLRRGELLERWSRRRGQMIRV